jgi:TRAP-type C4-dicarboxylate transport system permease small subunit
MKSLWNIFDRTLNIVVAVILIVLTLTTFIQVLLRYVFGGALDWSVELARYLFLWFCFLGFSITLRRGGHVSVRFIVDLFPLWVQRMLLIISDICIFIFLGFIIVEGGFLTHIIRNNISPVMQIPMCYVYIVIPISGILLIIYLLRTINRSWRSNHWIGGKEDTDA